MYPCVWICTLHWKYKVLKNSIWRGEKIEGSLSGLSEQEQTHLYWYVSAVQSVSRVCMKNTLKTQEGQWHVSDAVKKGYDPESYSNEIKTLKLKLILYRSASKF